MTSSTVLAAMGVTHPRRQTLLTIASQEPPPRRFLAGADAIRTAEQKIADLQADIESNRQLSTSLRATDAMLKA